MAIKPEVEYPAQTDPSSADYTYGSARDITVPGDNTGTPLQQAWLNDIWGFLQNLLKVANIIPTGTPDKVDASQYTEAIPFAAEPADNYRLFNRWGAENIRLIAHRGASAVYPENTIPAIVGARGMTDVHFNLRLSSDNEWVLMHDATVNRTTDGTGNVVDKTLLTLKGLDAGVWKGAYFAGIRIPTVDEALLAARKNKLRPLIELEVTASDTYRQNLIDSCIKFCDGYEFTIGSATIAELQAYRALDKRLNLIKLSVESIGQDLTDLALVQPCIGGRPLGTILEANVKQLHDDGYNVIAYSSGGEDSTSLDKALGVGAGGLITENLTGAML